MVCEPVAPNVQQPHTRAKPRRDPLASPARNRGGMKAAWIVLMLVLFVAGCGDDDPASRAAGWREHADERRGFRVALPPGWDLAEQSLSPEVTDPVEVFLAASFPLDESRGLCRSLERIPPDQALVTLQERGRGAFGGPDFPPRPATFEPDPSLPGTSTWPYCASGDQQRPIPMDDYWFGFGDGGRAFHVFVGVGKEVPAELRREAFAILDTLRFDPGVKPDWQSAG
jgi:hypothetical protein